MPNRRIDPTTTVRKRNLCFTDQDWALFNKLVGINYFKLSGISALLRLLTRAVTDRLDEDLGSVALGLCAEGYVPTLRGLVQRTLDKNDKIHN